jgi:hypothetical protein
MAVIINLKELFSSDAQDIYVDKVNFNFNKLLELGIGQPGPQGITGPLGSAGPQGIQGDDGQRGNKWFVGIGDPNTQTFPGLIIGDFYLETTTSSVYQYQGSPASWIMITDFTSIVNNIITGSTTPFVRGFGLASPDDHRYITFTRHGNDLADITTDINLGNSANNDTLLLNNWNEKVTTIDNFPTSTDDEFNSIQTLSVDHTITPLGRYHLELGSLYKDGPDTLLSDLNNNLKLRYTKEIATPTYYPASNGTINKAKFSLTLPESETNLSLIDQQGFFEFETPLYNIESVASQSRFYTKIGTTEPLKETSALDISSDGIEFKLNLHSLSLGMVRSIQDQINSGSNRLPSYMDGDYGILNISDSLKGTFIKENVYHTRGNMEKIHTHNEFESSNITSLGGIAGIGGVQGICSDGKYVMAVSQDTDATVNGSGGLVILDVSNPNEPVTLVSTTTTSLPPTPFAPPPDDYDVHGNASGNGPFDGYSSSSNNQMNLTPLTNARDIAFNGNIGVIVRQKPQPPSGPPIPGFDYRYDTFLVFEFGVNHPNSDRPSNIKNISWLNGSNTFSNFMSGSDFKGDTNISELDDLKRVRLVGNTAYCISGPDQLSGFVAGLDSYFIAIDLTNPQRPYLSSQNIKTSADSAHIDFDISDEVAYVASLYSTGFVWSLNLEKYSLSSLRTLSQGSLITNTTLILSGPLATLPSNSRGCVKVKGQQVYVGFGDRIYIRNIDLALDEVCSPISTILLSDSSYAVHDLQISGKYIYASITDGTDSALVVYDITDLANPFEVDGININDTDSIISRSTLVGNELFTVNEDNKSGTTVNKINLGGIVSPLGRIGNLHSNDLRVSEDAFVGGDMYVGNSISAGNGGIQTGRFGLHSTGPIVVDANMISNLVDAYTGVNSNIRGFVNQENNPTTLARPIAATINDMDLTPNTLGSPGLYQISGLDILASDIDFPLAADTLLAEFYGLRMIISNVTDNELAGDPSTLKKYGLYISETGSPTMPMMNVLQGKTWIGNDIVNGFDYQKSTSDYDLMLSTNHGNGGLRIKAHSSYRASGYDSSADIENGQWGIQYTKNDNSDDRQNGLNFWKPFPSHNQGNYKLFLSDNGSISMGFDPLPSFDYGVSGNQFMGKGYAYNTPWSSGAATVRLAVNGAIGCQYVVTTSDSRLKDNVIDIDNSLERILKTRPVFYSWKDQEAKIPHGGFLAQELEEVIPEAIRINKSNELEGGKYSLHYDTILAVSVGAIKELNKTIEEKEEKIKDLEKRLAAIEEKIGL